MFAASSWILKPIFQAVQPSTIKLYLIKCQLNESMVIFLSLTLASSIQLSDIFAIFMVV